MRLEILGRVLLRSVVKKKKLNLRCHSCEDRPKFLKYEGPEPEYFTNLIGTWRILGVCPKCGYTHKELVSAGDSREYK